MPELIYILRKWAFSLERWKKRLLKVVSDLLIIPMSLFLALFMRLETTDFLHQLDTYIGAFLAAIITLTVFALRGLYNTFSRHISIGAAYSIIIGSATSSAGLLITILIFGLQMPRSVPFIYAMILCVFATSVRFFIRALGDNITTGKRENVAIYGAGMAGVQLMESLRKNPDYRVQLFIDDNPELNGENLAGVPIKNFDNAKKIFEKLEINTLLLAVPSNKEATRQRVLDILSDHPMRVKTIPSISTLISGQIEVSELKDIKIEELLGREPVQPDPELMAKHIAQKIVLVTGAGGSIGSELCKQIIKWKPKRLVLLDISESAIYLLLEELKDHPNCHAIDLIPAIGSVQDNEFVGRVFDRFTIDTTYHAAAYKHVPLMEQNVMQCIENNVFGTLNMVELAIAKRVKNFILISTDKAVNPTNFMGASKRMAEMICQSLPDEKAITHFSIVRFGNVLGSSGSVVPLFKKQIENGGPVTVTHPDVNRYFMTIPEAAQLVIQAGSLAAGGDVFVLDMGEPTKILDLAKKMITLSGLKPTSSDKALTEDNEIVITLSGLRPGEKMFEELAYGTDLLGTTHSRIYTTSEVPMGRKQLKLLLASIHNAIRNDDHQKLFQIISTVTDGVSDVEGSSDIFIANGEII